ncbi:MAG: hypothetical protein ACOCRK_03705 [bacterium]
MLKIKPLDITAYRYEELDESAKNQAIYSHIMFWIENKEYDDVNKGKYEKAIDEAYRLNTPWFLNHYIYDYCKEEIIEELKTNEYMFDKNGTLLPLQYHYNRVGVCYKTTYTVYPNKVVEVKLVS